VFKQPSSERVKVRSMPAQELQGLAVSRLNDPPDLLVDQALR
jgi:hypothetical protein